MGHQVEGNVRTEEVPGCSLLSFSCFPFHSQVSAGGLRAGLCRLVQVPWCVVGEEPLLDQASRRDACPRQPGVSGDLQLHHTRPATWLCLCSLSCGFTTGACHFL